MRRVIGFVLVALLAWQGYIRYQRTHFVDAADNASEPSSPMPSALGQPVASFKCDGRTYCSQMTSCAEATFFLTNCPGVKMDGNNDGIPCERQWCKP